MSQLEKVLYAPGVFGLLRGHRLKRMLSCWLPLPRWRAGSPTSPPHLDSLMKRPPRSSWTKSRTDTATGS